MQSAIARQTERRVLRLARGAPRTRLAAAGEGGVVPMHSGTEGMGKTTMRQIVGNPNAVDRVGQP